MLGGVVFLFSSQTLPVGTWQHIAFTRQSGTWSLYLNGIKVPTTRPNDTPNTPSGNSYIGARQGNLENFNGEIDEVRFWNRGLTQCEIQNNSNTELSSGQIGLVAYYKFNQGIASGTNTGINSVPDSSGNSNTGTLTNFALAGSTSNWIAPGGVVTGSLSPAFTLLSVNTPQSFCANTNPTVANLTATGTAIKWYNVATGGAPLAGSTPLSPGIYYVTQTTSGCESPRTAVTVTFIQANVIT